MKVGCVVEKKVMGEVVRAWLRGRRLIEKSFYGTERSENVVASVYNEKPYA